MAILILLGEAFAMVKPKSLETISKPRALAGWTRFCRNAGKFSRQTGGSVIRAKVNKFHAKFRFAANLRSLDAIGYTATTIDGYTAGLRLFLAYTAGELLGNITEQSIDNWVIKDEVIARTLRIALRRVARSKEHIYNNTGINKISHFVGTKTHNVMPAAYCIRVLVAHGVFTAHGISAQTKNTNRALQLLSDKILDEAERRFNLWMDDQKLLKHREQVRRARPSLQ